MEPTVQSLIDEAHAAVVQGRHSDAAQLLNQALKRAVDAGEGDGEEARGIREDLDTLHEMNEVSAFRNEMGLSRLPGEPVTPDSSSE